jgi:hypothetical protein
VESEFGLALVQHPDLEWQCDDKNLPRQMLTSLALRPSVPNEAEQKIAKQAKK